MKYMTLKWWNQAQSNEYDPKPLQKYNDYYKSIKDILPTSFVTLHEEVFLHDGELYESRYMSSENNLILKVLNQNEERGPSNIKLEYQDVSLFELRANKGLGLPGPLGFGDIGYHEVEVLEGNYKHSITFSSGIEMNIICRNLLLSLK